MKTILKNIASIQTGVFAKPINDGQAIYLQAKHFDANGTPLVPFHPDLLLDGISEKHILQPYDVLFAAKGIRIFAAHYYNANMPSVASTSFFVIRLHENFRDNIIPEFLVWLINHPISQLILKGKAIGTSIASISKTVLEELEISIPDIATQNAILNITKLRNKELKIKEQIEELREKQIQHQFINAINN